MKKEIALIVFLLTGLFSFGQTESYFPFPTDSASWKGYVSYVQPPDFNPQYEALEFTIQGDTIIDDFTYQKVYYGLSYEPIPEFWLMGGLREDSLKQIFFFPFFIQNAFLWLDSLPSDTSEFMLYSFSDTLEVGMTIPINPDHSEIIITNIDSVLVGNNYRRRIKVFHSSINDDYWIEGIGGSKGLFSSVSYFFEWGTSLLCFTDSLTYTINTVYPDMDICSDWTVLTTIENSRESIKIFPNPATSNIRIESNVNLQNGYLKIYNSQGQVVHSQKLLEENAQINIQNIPPGLYLVEITVDGKRHITKLIKD